MLQKTRTRLQRIMETADRLTIRSKTPALGPGLLTRRPLDCRSPMHRGPGEGASARVPSGNANAFIPTRFCPTAGVLVADWTGDLRSVGRRGRETRAQRFFA